MQQWADLLDQFTVSTAARETWPENSAPLLGRFFIASKNVSRTVRTYVLRQFGRLCSRCPPLLASDVATLQRSVRNDHQAAIARKLVPIRRLTRLDCRPESPYMVRLRVAAGRPYGTRAPRDQNYLKILVKAAGRPRSNDVRKRGRTLFHLLASWVRR